MEFEENKDLPGDALSVTEARRLLTQLPERLTPEKSVIPLTRRGEPVIALMSWELYESITQTMEVMADEEIMDAKRRSAKDITAGRVHSHEEVKANLDRLGGLSMRSVTPQNVFISGANTPITIDRQHAPIKPGWRQGYRVRPRVR